MIIEAGEKIVETMHGIHSPFWTVGVKPLHKERIKISEISESAVIIINMTETLTNSMPLSSP